MSDYEIESMKLTADIDTLPTISRFFQEKKRVERLEQESKQELSVYEQYELTKKQLSI